MAKKSRNRARTRTVEGAVGPREPCPCGSGKRYKACHGSAAGAFVARPFAGLVAERDLVALREFVPSATSRVIVDGREVLLGTLLPMAAPAMVRESGDVWLGLQVRHGFGDPSRDLGAVLERALAADEPGVVGLVDDPGPGRRLQDLMADEPLDVEVHPGFEWWVGDLTERDPATAEALDQANRAVAPTVRLSSVEAAYWVDAGSKEHLRWVLPQNETALLDALARLHAGGDDAVAEGSRLVGMFRAHGLLTPVWDLLPGTGAGAVDERMSSFHERLEQALAATSELTSEQRAARSMLANHQVTLR